ncbi:MAG: TorF family putative porin [Bdellovibrionota bacterium]
MTRILFAFLLSLLTLRSPAVAAAPAKAAAVSSSPSILESENDDDDDEVAPPSVTATTEADDSDEEANPDEVSANIIFASDYLSRGLTQTAHKPALQGGLDWEHPTGIFLGAWASNVSLPDATESNLEFDSSAGYAFVFGKGFEESLSVHYVTYFSATTRANWAFTEETKWRDYSLGVTYSPSYRKNGYSYTTTAGWGKMVRWSLELGAFVDYTVFANQSLSTVALEETVDSEGEDIERQILVYEPTPNYADLRLSVGHEFLGTDWKLEGVYLKKQTIEGILALPRLTVSVSKEF